jgi:uncharacterized membrane protein YkoI
MIARTKSLSSRMLMAATLATLATLLLASGLARADGTTLMDHDDEAEAVYQAKKSGRFVPLASALAKASLPKGSEVVNVALENEHGTPVYEIYYIDPGGRRLKLRVDARNGDRIKEVGE